MHLPGHQLPGVARRPGTRARRQPLPRRNRECRYPRIEFTRADGRRRRGQRRQNADQGPSRRRRRLGQTRRCRARKRGSHHRANQPARVDARRIEPTARAGAARPPPLGRHHPTGPHIDISLHRTDTVVAVRRHQRRRPGPDRRRRSQLQHRTVRPRKSTPRTTHSPQRIRRRARPAARRKSLRRSNP